MKTSYIIGIIIVLVLIIISAYTYIRPQYVSQPQPSPTQIDVKGGIITNESTQTIPIETKSMDVSIDIKNYKFSPDIITVTKGTKITWTNNDNAPHVIASKIGSVFESPRLNPGQTFSYTFTDAGKINYYCVIHPSMKASITVN